MVDLTQAMNDLPKFSRRSAAKTFASIERKRAHPILER